MEQITLLDDGCLKYEATFLAPERANSLFTKLRDTIPWHGEGSRGRLFPRLVAWYADPGVVYTYSGITHTSSPWTPELLEIRARIEQATEAGFNSVLLNFYRDGRDSMGFHADDEPELGQNPVIASVSLGVARRFVLKHNRTVEKHEIVLEHGSLLVMGGTCQHFWKHAIPKTAKVVGPRINLTFRQLQEQVNRWK